MGVRSLKTGVVLARKDGAARSCVVPLCSTHHREGPDSVHRLGHGDFEYTHRLWGTNGVPDLMQIAWSLMAAYIAGED